MTVYVLLFSSPLGNPNTPHGTAQTYIGWCRSEYPERRVAKHVRGQGAAIVRAAVEQGLEVRIAAVIPGATRADERRLKDWKKTPRLLARWRERPTYRQSCGEVLPVLFPGYGEGGL